MSAPAGRASKQTSAPSAAIPCRVQSFVLTDLLLAPRPNPNDADRHTQKGRGATRRWIPFVAALISRRGGISHSKQNRARLDPGRPGWSTPSSACRSCATDSRTCSPASSFEGRERGLATASGSPERKNNPLPPSRLEGVSCLWTCARSRDALPAPAAARPKERAMSEKVIVFDTTLRDGEQAAGVCFSRRDKLEIAERLAAMRVDVIEAGFPAASPGELDAVAAVARQVRRRERLRARARRRERRRRRRARAARRAPPAHPRVREQQRSPARAAAAQEPRGRAPDGARGADPRASLHRRHRVQPDGRDALRSGLPGRDRAGRARRGRHHDQRARHGGLHPAGPARGAAARAARARAPARRGRALVPRPGRSGARDGKLPGGGGRRRASGRARRERHR